MHVQLARTQRTERLRLQAIAPDGEGGHTPWLRPLGRDAIQAQVREPAPEYSAIARKARESMGTQARNGASRCGWKRTTFARGGPAAENRGVPGSSPGLAIARNSRWLLDFGLSGVLDAIPDLGLGSPDLGLAG